MEKYSMENAEKLVAKAITRKLAKLGKPAPTFLPINDEDGRYGLLVVTPNELGLEIKTRFSLLDNNEKAAKSIADAVVTAITALTDDYETTKRWLDCRRIEIENALDIAQTTLEKIVFKLYPITQSPVERTPGTENFLTYHAFADILVKHYDNALKVRGFTIRTRHLTHGNTPLRNCIREAKRLHKIATAGTPLKADPVLARVLGEMPSDKISRLLTFMEANPVPSEEVTLSGNWNPDFLIRHDIFIDPRIETIRYKDGVLHGRIRLAPDIGWNNGRLNLSGLTLPDTIMNSFKGQRLGKLIEHPLLDPEVLIEDVKRYTNGRIVAYLPRTPVPVTTLIKETSA